MNFNVSNELKIKIGNNFYDFRKIKENTIAPFILLNGKPVIWFTYNNKKNKIFFNIDYHAKNLQTNLSTRLKIQDNEITIKPKENIIDNLLWDKTGLHVESDGFFNIFIKVVREGDFNYIAIEKLFMNFGAQQVEIMKDKSIEIRKQNGLLKLDSSTLGGAINLVLN